MVRYQGRNQPVNWATFRTTDEARQPLWGALNVPVGRTQNRRSGAVGQTRDCPRRCPWVSSRGSVTGRLTLGAFEPHTVGGGSGPRCAPVPVRAGCESLAGRPLCSGRSTGSLAVDRSRMGRRCIRVRCASMDHHRDSMAGLWPPSPHGGRALRNRPSAGVAGPRLALVGCRLGVDGSRRIDRRPVLRPSAMGRTPLVGGPAACAASGVQPSTRGSQTDFKVSGPGATRRAKANRNQPGQAPLSVRSKAVG
jgi:hypothetical protein